MNRRDFVLGAGGLAVSACAPDYVRASSEEVRAAYYHADGPPLIALLSMVNEWGNKSEHSGLLISGNQRVLYDPAGTYDPSQVTGWVAPPRKFDIHYGMTDRALAQYQSFHARRGYFVHKQTVQVPLEVANKAIQLSEQRGETKFTQCATSVSWVLKQLPGFGHVKSTLFPESIRKDLAEVAGVQDTFIREDDEGQNY